LCCAVRFAATNVAVKACEKNGAERNLVHLWQKKIDIAMFDNELINKFI